MLYANNIIVQKNERRFQIMNPDKMSNPNEGIKCIVNTCHYYMQGDHCTAQQIEVQPKNASTSNETDCATFRPENRAY